MGWAIGCLASSIPAVEPPDHCVMLGPMREIVASWRLTLRSTTQDCCCQCLCPHGTAACASTGDPPVLADRSGPVSYGVSAFSPLGHGAHKTFVPSKMGISVSLGPLEVL